MSTDDLTRRAREWAAGPIAARSSESTFALMSELADEVDRLRASLSEAVTARNFAMRQRDEEARAKGGNIDALNAAIIERNAARAALERLNVVHRDLREAWDTARENEDWS